jgi:hypothetical protein
MRKQTNTKRNSPSRWLFVVAIFCCASMAANAKTQLVNYAQLLVDHVVFENPGVLSVEIHAVAPNSTDTTIIAINEGESGIRSNAEVLAVIKSNQPVLKLISAQNRYRVVLPFRNASNATIGALSLAFRLEPNQPVDRYLERAQEIRYRLQELTPKLETLFDPYSKGYEATDNLVQRINQVLLSRHPDINVVAIHVTKPGDKNNKVWGINRPNFLGRDSDEIDTDTEKTGRIVMQVIPATNRMEVHMPLLSPEGALIGTLCTVYFWHDERESADYYSRSLAIMNEARLLTPSNRDDLFRP